MQHDIFISYKRGPDEERVSILVGALRANGFSVWWDRDIPANAPWEETIQHAIEAAKIVLVCWSQSAVASENVRSEARWAKERGKLLQVFVERCEPPLFFGEHQGLMLLDNADVYGPKFIAVRDAAQALIGRVDAGAASNLSPEDRAARDRLAQQYQRDEPAAPWEAGQFGLTLALFALVFGVAVWVVGSNIWTQQLEGQMPLLVVGMGLTLLTPLAAFLGGWVGYSWLARRPRRVGFFTATILALVASAVGLVVVLTAAAIVRAMTGTNDPVTTDALSRAIYYVALLAAPGGFIIARLWTPIFLGLLRTPLSRGGVRGGVLMLAVVMITGAGAGGVFHASQMTEASQRAGAASYYARRAGIIPRDITVGAILSRDEIRRVQAAMGVPQSGVVSEEMLDRLREMERKTEWVLAPNGAGDGDDLRDIMDRSAGDITIRVRPGTYSAGDLQSVFSYEEESLFEDSAQFHRAVTVVGDDRNTVILEVGAGQFLMQSEGGMSNLTLRGTGAATEFHDIVMFGTARLFDVTLDGGRWGITVRPPDTSLTNGRDRSVTTDNAYHPETGAQIRGLIANTLVTIAENAEVDFAGNRFTRDPGFDNICMQIEQGARISIIDSDFSACPRARYPFGAITANMRADVRVQSNIGLTAPRVQRDPNSGYAFQVY